jgi:hypothetical protein
VCFLYPCKVPIDLLNYSPPIGLAVPSAQVSSPSKSATDKQHTAPFSVQQPLNALSTVCYRGQNDRNRPPESTPQCSASVKKFIHHSVSILVNQSINQKTTTPSLPFLGTEKIISERPIKVSCASVLMQNGCCRCWCYD